MKKVIHKRTNVVRACKIIEKNKTKQEQIDRIMNEVEILKNIVENPRNSSSP